MILEKVRMDSGVKKDYLENTLVFIKVIETSEYKYMGKTDPLLKGMGVSVKSNSGLGHRPLQTSSVMMLQALNMNILQFFYFYSVLSSF